MSCNSCLRFHNRGGTYVLIHDKTKRWMLYIGIILAIAILVISINADFSNEMFSSALWIIPSALIIPVVTEKNLPTLKPLIRIGNISFELFLIHQLVIRYLSVVFNYIGFSDTIGRSVVLAVIALATSIIAAILYRRLQNRFSERKLVNEGISK